MLSNNSYNNDTIFQTLSQLFHTDDTLTDCSIIDIAKSFMKQTPN